MYVSVCIFPQAPSMDVKNMWVSEIRKVLTGQLEACRGTATRTLAYWTSDVSSTFLLSKELQLHLAPELDMYWNTEAHFIVCLFCFIFNQLQSHIYSLNLCLCPVLSWFLCFLLTTQSILFIFNISLSTAECFSTSGGILQTGDRLVILLYLLQSGDCKAACEL